MIIISVKFLNSREGFIGMATKKHFILLLIIFTFFVMGCSVAGEAGLATIQSTGLAPSAKKTTIPAAKAANPTAAAVPTINYPVLTQQPITPSQTASPTSTFSPTPT